MQTRRAKVRRQGQTAYYLYPELRMTNSWLIEAGFEAGDFVNVDVPEPNAIVITLRRRAQPEDAPGYSLGKALKGLG